MLFYFVKRVKLSFPTFKASPYKITLEIPGKSSNGTKMLDDVVLPFSISKPPSIVLN